VGKLEELNHLEDVVVDGRITLKVVVDGRITLK